MDETPTAINENAGETNVTEAPTVEQQTTDGVVTEQAAVASDPSTQPETQQPEVKKPTRLEKRLHQLLEKDKEEEASDYRQPYSAYSNDLPMPPWAGPQVQPGQEVTPEQYKADVTRSAAEIADLKIKQFEKKWAERSKQEREVSKFNQTVDQVYHDYPVIAENSEVEGKILNLYKKASGNKPNASLLRDIADTVMSLSNQARVEGQSTVTNRLVQQASEAAITPTATRTEEVSTDALMKMKPEERVKYLEKMIPSI